MIVSETSTEFEKVSEGTHGAICCRLIDLGTQENGGGFPGKSRKILVGWEIPNETDSDGNSLQVASRYTLSLGEKANLRKDLESWRAKKFTADELKGFDLRALLGAPCLLTVVHSDDGKYANVQSVTKLPQGMAINPPRNEHEYFSWNSPDWDVFEGFSERLKERLEATPEYAASGRPEMVKDSWAASEPTNIGAGDDFNDIPF